ncbi:MAG: site-specific recombinase [Pseudomonadota bacterium]
MRDLDSLLAALDPQASLARRHLWLINLLAWIRGDQSAPLAAVNRLMQLADAVERQPELQQRLQAWWATLARTVDITILLADFGFAPRTAFVSELAERLRRKLLPGTPETVDASELFSLALPTRFDALWLNQLDEALLVRLSRLVSANAPATADNWQGKVLEAIAYCSSQVSAAGFSPELRLRMSEQALTSQPFHALALDVAQLQVELMRRTPEDAVVQAAVARLRERLEACRQAVASVYAHLDDHGISVGLVFRLRQVRERILRIRELLDCLLSPTPALSAVKLLARLVNVGQDRYSIRALVAANSTLLAAKMAERSAETGEHYITRTRVEYASMLQKAAGGGALTALTTLLKFMLGALALSAFWAGFWAGAMYAASFVLIQLLHCTLATKQPAMTAPAMAAKLKDLGSGEAVGAFVDEVTHLVRSQVAAVLGNVLVVFPVVLLLSGAIYFASGHPMIDAKEAEHVLHSLTLLGPTLLFAAFTGVLLFAASLMAGWAENWFVFYRLDSAMRYNPRITAVLGAQRAGRWAGFMRRNVSGFASNIALGFMLGLVPAFAAFFGLGLEARHVTLSTGQLAAACAALGWDIVRNPALWWCVAAIPLIGALNLGVSFYLAFRLALQAHNVSGVDRARIRAAIWKRVRSHPASFFVPARA